MKLDAHILVVDDDASQREELAGFLADLGAEVREASDGREALESILRHAPDLCITDFRMPRMDGGELLHEIRQVNPDIGVILVTAYGNVEGAVACLKDGAAEYLLKPLDLDEVEHIVRKLLDARQLRRENRDLKERLSRVESVPGIVTAGGAMTPVLSMVARVARSTASVLLQGESGTGKELVARAIHSAGARSDAPFVAVNAGALSRHLLESELFGHEKGAFTGADRPREGRFQAAEGGTLFLDEIGDLPQELQVKLLRALQERTIERVGSNRPVPVDVRVVAATHRDLALEIREGRFREDLYYRLAVVSVDLPPLRSRKADIPLLVDHFLHKHRADLDGSPAALSREAMDLLIAYDFPGNVRELENIVRRGMVLARGDQITVDDLPASVLVSRNETGAESAAGETLPGRMAALEKEAIQEALAQEKGVIVRAAHRLGISERALRYKAEKYELKS
ncbi:MAG: sigma-54-dependent Fis family transcriptional regulator [Acidobacteria bacterium]|uniref:Sigma-54-dependent Fis family transcriptional regulator n=1 Tax=Candidatus Polarisedimenticola svalbardensis TaxID=2886004 RepID=A0A8J6Y120_9BACT|nr:sigma-54-dependent Fis family transcriptional regulator [Candidatus Polarisedimenticola svalbardensis]